MIDQIAIGLCGVTAVFLSQDKRESVRRYACLFGLASQPFWFWTTWHAHQYGIFSLSFLYAFSWVRGFYAHWIKAKPESSNAALADRLDLFARTLDPNKIAGHTSQVKIMREAARAIRELDARHIADSNLNIEVRDKAARDAKAGVI
jgi:hypothetical protein